MRTWSGHGRESLSDAKGIHAASRSEFVIFGIVIEVTLMKQ
jgi:hypothetical protein